MTDTATAMPMGIDGFTYADLHDPARLGDLYGVFCRQIEAADPQFWGEWDRYRREPDAVRTPMEVSDLIVRMAPHVSRFVSRLFGVDEARHGTAAVTESMDALFRFKTDFVRKRALPLLKGHAHVALDPADAAVVDRLFARHAGHLDPELALATEGCALLDREAALRVDGSEADKADVASQLDALKRWCAAHVHH
jgi:hypothetical protein